MVQRLATQLREQMQALVDRYDAQLSTVPGYADLPPAARRELEARVLHLMADCLDENDDSRLLQYIQDRAEQVLTRGFQPEWFQQAVVIPQEIIAPLAETVAESHFVWRTLGHAQSKAWEIVAEQRRRVEQALRESEALYQTVFDATPIMFWLKDTQNRTLRINQAAARFEGVNPAEVEGKSAYDLYPYAQAKAFHDDDLEVIRTNRPKLGIVEQHTVPSTGELMVVETGKTPVHNAQGEATGVLAFAIDVSQRQRIEAALRDSAAQQERAAHYLRATVEAAKELNQAQDIDTLCRRTVELAREKFDIERCGLYLLDESLKSMRGTFGTDDQGHTTDERHAQRGTDEFSYLLLVSEQQLWVVRDAPHVYYDDEGEHKVGAGWTAGTVLRGAARPLAVLFNDRAISGAAVDTTQQEALAVYCSAVGSILERMQLEEQARESFVRRGVQVRTSTEVAQEIASATEISDLFQRVVTLIKERFNYYHVQIFRYEPDQDAVVLLTGYGDIGQHMLADGHRLRMGHGVVGTAAANGQSILAADVQQDADWRPNPHLPDTRGELAVPIKWRDQVLGILDVQSNRVNALTDDDRLLLEGLCGQIASAMQSTRLLDQLRQNQVQLSEALKIAKLAYWEYDVAKDLFLFNDQFYALFHTTVEQVGSYQISSAQYAGTFVHPDDLPIVGAEIERALTSTDRHYSRDLVHRVRYADGGVGYISVNINIDRDENGQILRYYGANQDITEQKLAELDLQKFKLGLDRSTSAIFITDTSGAITYANPAFETIYGYTREEVIGQTPRIIKSGIIPQEQYQHFWAALLAGQTVAGEIVNKAKDGRLVPVQGSNSAILDERGVIIGFLALHADITDRKRTEEELARSAQLLNTIIDTSRDLIYVKDTQSRFLVASQAVVRLMGLTSPQELLGKNDYDFFPYELAHKYFTDEQKILASGEALIDIEESASYPDGTRIWLLTTKIPYRAADGTLQGIVGIGRDITERKHAEQRMEETLHETERLYAAVSHEGWQAYRQTGQLPGGYVFDQALIKPADQVWEPEIAQALAQQTQVAARSAQRAVAVSPLTARGEALGALGVYDDPAHPLSDEDLQLIDAVAEQVALALESARLFDQSQRDAEREYTINRVTSRIRNARSVDEVLSIAAQELRLATRASRSVVEILPDAEQLIHSGHGEGVKA
jgi:PAS domain S-box-containing protein